jgi:3',5'-cyclic AMP phosphodiesterase CpdA
MNPTRRDFLSNLSLLGVAGLAGPMLSAAEAAAKPAPKGGFRIAHLTDIHMCDRPVAFEGMAKVLAAVKVSGAVAVINTGDSFMELNGRTLAEVESHWAAWRKAFAGFNLPVHSCLGNHDVWTPPKGDAPNHQGHAGLAQEGKAGALTLLGMPAPYYAVRIGKWRFLMCDSMGGRRYSFGEKQLAWIESQLSELGDGEHAALCCHVPIQSPGAWMYMVNHQPSEKWGFPYGDLQRDLKEVTQLLRRFPRARAALTGHIHYVDQADYLGVRHLNSGAVSGNWWKGVLDNDFPPAFGLVDFHADGTVERQMVSPI